MEIQSFPRQVLARHGRNTSVQPYRGMHMNSDVLMRKNVAEKMYMRKAYRPKRQAQIVRLITKWFVSEHRKSCDRKTSAQSNQKMVFKRIRPHSPVNGNFFFVYLVLYDSGHAQLDCVALVLFCGPYDRGKSETFRRSLIR